MGRTFYRIVKTDPPNLEDFKSYRELGILLLRTDAESRRLADGISVYATLAQARRAARSQPFLGRFIAEVVIPDDGSLTLARTGKKPGHHTIWCDPREELASQVLKYVTSVLPV